MPISQITATLIAAFKDPILEFVGDLRKEILFFMDNGLSDYIESIRSKFIKAKLFNRGSESLDFYKVFYPITLKSELKLYQIQRTEQLFEKTRFVTIIGGAGTGKTMMLKHLFLSSIENLYRIPLFIEFRTLNSFNGNLKEFIDSVIFNNRLSPDERIMERLLETGQFLFVLDGYDELFSANIERITNELDKFIDRYHKNHFIISSRPGSGLESFPRFETFEVQPLDPDDIPLFIEKVSDDEGLNRKIISNLEEPESQHYVDFLSTPLLLSMFILTYENYPELPTKLTKFYWNVFDTLTVKHDTNKQKGYLHERKTALKLEQLEAVLEWFSYISLFEGRYDFDDEYLVNKFVQIREQLGYEFRAHELTEDLSVSIGLLIIDGTTYRFPHRSMQEYFSSRLISKQKPEKIERIYLNKLPKYLASIGGGADNFFNLLLENDRYNFTGFFLLRQLNSFLSHFKLEDKMKDLQTFFDDGQMYCKLTYKQMHDDSDIKAGFIETNNSEFVVFIQVLKYFKFYRIVRVGPFECLNFLKQAKNKESMKYDFIDFLYISWRKNELYQLKGEWMRLRKYFRNSDVPEKFQALLLGVKEKIEQLQRDLEDNDAISDSLLGI